MQAVMVVTMNIKDPSWMSEYFKVVPGILADHGAVSFAASRRITSLEGQAPAPQRVAIFTFPSMDALNAFMADERYAPYRRAREEGAETQMLVFENALVGKELI